MFSKLKSLFKKKDDEIVAIVTIERAPRLISRVYVETICQKLNINATITEEQTSYMRVLVDGWNFVVFSLPIPYKPFTTTKFTEMRMKQAISDHTGYFVVECMGCPPGQDRKDSRPILAKLTADIIDDQSLAIYDWSTARYAVLDQKIVEFLADGDLDGAVRGYDSLVFAARDDLMHEAIEEAKRRWPEFCNAFANPHKDQKFIVKGAFRWNDHVEHMWVTPSAAYPDRVEGKLRNVPVNLPKPKCGDQVTILLEDISDWSYTTENGGSVGMFTQAALEQQMQ